MLPKPAKSARRGDRPPERAADLQRLVRGQLDQAETIFDLTGDADALEDVALLRRLIALEGDVPAAAAWGAGRIAHALERIEQADRRSRGGRATAAKNQQRDAKLLATWRRVRPGRLEGNDDGTAGWLVRNGQAPGLTEEAVRMILRKYRPRKGGER
jgi:hypothetical protein